MSYFMLCRRRLLLIAAITVVVLVSCTVKQIPISIIKYQRLSHACDKQNSVTSGNATRCLIATADRSSFAPAASAPLALSSASSNGRILGQNRLTSARHSTYRLVSKRTTTGSLIHLAIQAKDTEGVDQQRGGDFWLALLTSETTWGAKGARAAGRVEDHDNGSYSVYFYAGWRGPATVHVILAAPSSTIDWIKTKYWPTEKRVMWLAKFTAQNTHGKYTTETSSCFISRTVSSSDLCVIDPKPKAMGLTRFCCEKPKKLRCDDFKTQTLNIQKTIKRTAEILQGDRALFKGDNFLKELVNGPKRLLIEDRKVLRKLPVCSPDNLAPVTDGFWVNNTYHNFHCRVRHWDDVIDVRKCLRHRKMLFHGDSNIRLWYIFLTRKLGYPWEHLGNDMQKLRMDHHYRREDIQMKFLFHPHVVSDIELTLNITSYEVDVLDRFSSENCSNYVIVLCPWGHFTQWTRESFVERTNLLKDAVMRFRGRCPDVPVIIKGSHAREHFSLEMRVNCNDYILRNLGLILEKTFRGTGVYYFDIWQMNLAYGTQAIHMPLEVIDEELNWLLSYLCP